jgi:hypothetical protein
VPVWAQPVLSATRYTHPVHRHRYDNRGRRKRKINIVVDRSNAREERLSNRRRIAPDGPTMLAFFGASSSTNDAKRSLDELPTNARAYFSEYKMLATFSAALVIWIQSGVQGKHFGTCIGPTNASQTNLVYGHTTG